MRRIAMTALLILTLAGLAPGRCLADGIIIPRPIPPSHEGPWQSLAIKYHRVSVTIGHQVATTHVDQVFVNDSGEDIEGEYVFPLPAGASINQFAMWVDGKRLEAQILESDEARQIYEDIVRQSRDPALLEYAGRNAFRARIYPIPAHGEKRVELEYSEVLTRDGGVLRYTYPLSTEKFSSEPLEEVDIRLSITSEEEIKSVYSPSHEIKIDRLDPRNVEVSYHEEDVLPDSDLILYYTVSDEEVGLDLLSYRRPPEDGFFLMLLSSGAVSDKAEIVAKDVCIVLDTSGSMRGEKLSQAKDAARYVLQSLNEEDRFNIVGFSSTVRAFESGMQGIDRRDSGFKFVDSLVARGGTNIYDALMEALAQAEPDRPQVILFLTDGLPTEGKTNTDEIITAVEQAADDAVRLFCFGVGYDVNTILLDTMAEQQHGTTTYVRPGENIETAVSSLYDKISMPVLTDVELQVAGVSIEDVYPHPMPDIFAGSQAVVVGRYRNGGSATVTLRGLRGDEKVTLTYEDVTFAETGGEESVPRLWATRKIGHLLSQIRLHGADKELIDEIVALSVEYGIVTPYTSFLVDETEDALSPDGRQELAERTWSLQSPLAAAPSLQDGWGGGGPLASGREAVEKSITEQTLRSAERVVEPEDAQVVHVGLKSFVLREGVWMDTAFDTGSMSTERLTFGSARYFALLQEHPEWGHYLALGERVIFVWEGKAYEVVPEGAVAQEEHPLARRPWADRVR